MAGEDERLYPAQPPPPMPPPQAKTDIYLSPEEFAEVDQLAIDVRNVEAASCFYMSFFSKTQIETNILI